MEINETLFHGKWNKNLLDEVQNVSSPLNIIDPKEVKLYCKYFTPGGGILHKDPKIAIEIRHKEYGMVGCTLLTYDKETNDLKYLIKDASGTIMTGSKHGRNLYLTNLNKEWTWKTEVNTWKITRQRVPDNITEVKSVNFLGIPQHILTVNYDDETHYFTKTMTTGMELYDFHTQYLLAKVSKESLWRRVLHFKPQGIYFKELDQSINRDIALSILITAFVEKLRFAYYAARSS